MQETSTARCYWVADIGGTSLRWAIVSEEGEVLETRRSATSVAHWEAAWNSPVRSTCAGAVVAVAGPVVDGVVSLTNGNLLLDERRLTAQMGRPVRVVNDLVAAAAGVAVNAAGRQFFRGGGADGPFWVVGLGTGVGASLVVPGKSHTTVLPGEFGHSAVSPWDFGLGDADLLTPIEDLLSGSGFIDWARRWQSEGRIALTADALGLDVDAGVVLAAPYAEWSALRKAYSRLLGAVLGDLAMAVTVPGGMHLIGGFAQAMLPHVDMAEFERGFCGSRRLRLSVENVGVSVVDGNPALVGAAAIGQGRVVVGA